MNIFTKLWKALGFFVSLFGKDAEAVQEVITEKSPLVKAAKPVIQDIAKLVPDTKVAADVARTQVRSMLTHHFSLAEVDQFLGENLGLTVKQLLAAVAKKILLQFPITKGFSDSEINFAIEFALQILRIAV